MDALNALSLSLIMLALAAIPSSSVALVVARSSVSGFAHGAAVAAGVVCGDLIFVYLAILGMTALADTLGGLFLVIRYLAGAYLIWFGLSLIRSRSALDSRFTASSKSRLTTSFSAGLLLTLGDVKAILFYSSLFPVFVDMSSLTAPDITAIIAITVITVGGVKLLYARLAQKITARFINSPMASAAKTTAGAVLVGSGAYLIVKG
ncbi:LysE family translocator [Hahella sp. CR1]|uniref:LysE family translocator n=1 Tax=Hahella sp. CR1 TaxID=2992807 RepID=UPI002442C8F7|nr:LysE family translocator [Hahella sp. CR1]MDG9666980.1 LysE family translocator [Hahella sp. CR1]